MIIDLCSAGGDGAMANDRVSGDDRDKRATLERKTRVRTYLYL